MRRTLAATLFAAVTALAIGGLAPSASAVCDGEPCSDCGGTITILKKDITLWNC
jgi:hypothetical protein